MFHKISYTLSLALYYGLAQYLPDSYTPLVGPLANRLRIFCCKHIFRSCGKISTVNRRANFGNGKRVEIGDYSGIGSHCHLPNDIKIGRYVMMGPELYIVIENHCFDNISVPMCLQGKSAETRRTIIEDDCWIGYRAIFTQGRHLSQGTIVGAGAVVTHDFPPYSIIGGNPAHLIRLRKEQSQIS